MLYIQIGSAWSCLPANNLNSWNENSHKCATAHASVRPLAVNACTEHIIELNFKRFWTSAFRVNLNDESSLFVSPIFELFSRKYVQLHHLLSCWTARLNWYTIWMRKYFFSRTFSSMNFRFGIFKIYDLLLWFHWIWRINGQSVLNDEK